MYQSLFPCSKSPSGSPKTGVTTNSRHFALPDSSFFSIKHKPLQPHNASNPNATLSLDA